MPILEWIGKDKVINHHQEVPFRILERQYSYDENGYHEGNNRSDNMIIHGDNLEALKALLPEYEGKIQCIYIDPPYNTGNENWVYNDNVNDPRIKKWLGEVVGKEGEDLSRHDKWLCMMYPRLRLLHRLLSEEGAIFISIDDNELFNLKLMCDEIFGANCFINSISWQRTYSMRNDSKGIPSEVEYILVYSKNSNWNPKKLPRTEEMDSKYKNPDNDEKGAWQNTSAFAPGAATHQGMVYAVQHPFTGKMLYPTNGACWRYSQEAMLEYMNGWTSYRLADLHDEKERADVCGLDVSEIRKGVLAIVLDKPIEMARKEAQKIYERGNWPRFYFTNGGKGGIRRKTYLDSVDGKPPTNLWHFSDVGHTDEAAKTLRAVFEGKAAFDTPKPYRLIERILQIATEEDSLILDSFAGSGTTAHAVLNMNKADNGKRKFILVEMGDYADGITAERVKRVIDGYGKEKQAVEGTGGSFSYYELGAALFEDENLNKDIGTERIREYIWYMETKRNFVPGQNGNRYYLGADKGIAYYFYYELNEICTLNYAFFSTIREKAESYVIYADRCALSEEELAEFSIVFKKIPRDISRL